jgi:hypothetical protein
MPRPVHVKSRTYIGKEVVVDPTDTDEEFTAEMPSATEVLEYRNPAEEVDVMRARIRVIGVNSVADASGLDRRTLQRFVNGKTSLHASSMDKLKAATR